MVRTLRRYLASCALDRPGQPPAGEFSDVHRQLSESAPMHAPSSGLRTRIMDGLHDADAPAAPGVAWRWALAGVACLLLTAAAVPLVNHRATTGPVTEKFAGFQIPVGASPMLRLVSGSVDKPLLDQAQKMYEDTKRATRVVAGCVPFALRGG